MTNCVSPMGQCVSNKEDEEDLGVYVEPPSCECCGKALFPEEIWLYVIVESHNEDLIGSESSFCQTCEKGTECKDAMGTHVLVTVDFYSEYDDDS